MEDTIDKYTELSFHGIDYIIKLNATTEYIKLELEQKNSGEIWRNTFQTNYIEEITQKTGNTKKYSVFLKMLVSAIQQNSDSVFLDILSFQDLEMLKSRKNMKRLPNQQNNNSQQSIQNIQIQNKRYFILTYVVEFDKVHYPLPLNYEENPDPVTLKATIRRLRIELDEYKNVNFSTLNEGNCNQNSQKQIIQFKQENDFLRTKIKKLEEQVMMTSSQISQNGNSSFREEELKNLKENFDKKDKENIELKNEIYKLKGQIAQINEVELQAKKQCKDSENVVQNSHLKIEQMENKIKILSIELDDFKKIEKKLKQRISQLEFELEGALSRNQGTKRQRSASKVSNHSASKRTTSMPIRNQSPLKINSTPRNLKKNLKKTPQKHLQSVESDNESVKNGNKKSYRVSPLKNSTTSYNNSSLYRRNSPQNKSSQYESDEESRIVKKLQDIKSQNQQKNYNQYSDNQSNMYVQNQSQQSNYNNNYNQKIQNKYVKSEDIILNDDLGIEERIQNLQKLMDYGKK